MPGLRAAVATEHASRYLQQLCKHWSHRFPTSFDPAQGTVELTGATCRFQAGPSQLLLTLDGDGDLQRLCGVVADHLRRFAFREELAITWEPAA